ncbi:aldolase [Haloechinothrix sp. LS1_15]|uniref:Cgl0159 family (beta/alpha)8-fold protein n=1 Tax=Haloechinothrix sp. LS1_15 TaxID=2652248 RepID=UPI002944B4ED|nr:aldolase [Haloechinothrix sp. LS1_15]MDV6012592.1 aldolase [Haloechinothrix sp. LS1_15]
MPDHRIPDAQLREITRSRVYEPEAVVEAAARRTRAKSPTGSSGKSMIIAADHPARGANAVGSEVNAMADRAELLGRIRVALRRPGVTGILGTADLLDDLLLLGELEGMVVIGSMNRAGLAGSVFEIDDRFTGYDAATLEAMGFDGGKMLTRIALDDSSTPAVLEASARAVNELAGRELVAMIEPFLSHWTQGTLRNDLSPDAVIRSVTIASGLGSSSAHTWLKLPAVADIERVMAATTLPALLLGGEVTDRDAALASWARALACPNVYGLIVGRSLLYPHDDDVASAVDEAVSLL